MGTDSSTLFPPGIKSFSFLNLLTFAADTPISQNPESSGCQIKTLGEAVSKFSSRNLHVFLRSRMSEFQFPKKTFFDVFRRLGDEKNFFALSVFAPKFVQLLAKLKFSKC